MRGVTGATPFEMPFRIRYLEADQQGVVFNMWYLAYFDDASTAFLAAQGIEYTAMMAGGVDLQLVHTAIDWFGPLRYGEDATVAVETRSVGTTSFTLGFTVHGPDGPVCRAETVYVVVSTDGSGKRGVPDDLRRALGTATAG
jgi:acyl-CoA thioester hydrolase